ncbi:HTTM domain-containing protein [Balamuthia mandrillaris]
MDLRYHYTDLGVFPRSTALGSSGSENLAEEVDPTAPRGTAVAAVGSLVDATTFCFHNMSGALWFQAMLFLVHAWLACLLLVGRRTALSTFGLWLMTCSLHARNVLVLHAGDVYLRMCLFWAMFLPLSSCYALDSIVRMLQNPKPHAQSKEHGRKSQSHYVVLSAGTFAMTVQVAIMYITSVHHKSGKTWMEEGTATFYALQLDYFRMPLGEFLLYWLHPTWLPWLTSAVWTWEWLGGVLLFFPPLLGSFITFLCCCCFTNHQREGQVSTTRKNKWRRSVDEDKKQRHTNRSDDDEDEEKLTTVIRRTMFSQRAEQEQDEMEKKEREKAKEGQEDQAEREEKETENVAWAKEGDGGIRTFAVFGYMMMHLGFALCLRLGTFFWISIAALTALLPAFFWDGLVLPCLRRFRNQVRKRRWQQQMQLQNDEDEVDIEESRGGARKKGRKGRGLTIYFSKEERKALGGGRRITNNCWSLWLDARWEILANIIANFCLLPDSQVLSLPSSSSSTNTGIAVIDPCNGRLLTDPVAVFTCIFAESPLLWPIAWLLSFLSRQKRLYPLLLRIGAVLTFLKDLSLILFLGEEGERRIAARYQQKKVSATTLELGQQTVTSTSLSPSSSPSPFSSSSFSIFSSPTSFYSSLSVERVLGYLLRWTKFCFCIGCLLLVFTWNMGNIAVYTWTTPLNYHPLVYTLRLDQNWNMFSPDPPDYDWWYIIEAWLVNGSTVELHRNEGMQRWQGNPLGDWSKPSPFAPTYKSHRWYKFYEQLNSHVAHDKIRLAFGRFICREWNQRHKDGETLFEFKIWWMSEKHNLDGSTTPQPKQMLWHHQCLDEKPSLSTEPPPSPAGRRRSRWT